MAVLIRAAHSGDIPDLHRMLLCIAAFHGQARPDIFKTGASKYTPEELQELLCDETYRIFVAEDAGVCGYVFCILQTVQDHLLLQNRKELYVDDLFVDPDCRGKGTATLLMQKAQEEAERCGCDCVTLNVWNVPHSALPFYEKLGYTERKRYMELSVDNTPKN
ncbi:MAG: GNAT family N-acetyltransferase [Clostridia bacterium]|nr:GNAT family N-acetyltransferase [Clostridia bacterium]MBR2413802.1 GNAT family N-acetyltransferase [Clostridia bacterium]MBR3954094.1 GNAT family N-acetyltransferase [Clostridia bacterium]